MEPEVGDVLRRLAAAKTDEEKLAIEAEVIKPTDNSARDGDLDPNQVKK